MFYNPPLIARLCSELYGLCAPFMHRHRHTVQQSLCSPPSLHTHYGHTHTHTLKLNGSRCPLCLKGSAAYLTGTRPLQPQHTHLPHTAHRVSLRFPAIPVIDISKRNELGVLTGASRPSTDLNHVYTVKDTNRVKWGLVCVAKQT